MAAEMWINHVSNEHQQCFIPGSGRNLKPWESQVLNSFFIFFIVVAEAVRLRPLGFYYIILKLQIESETSSSPKSVVWEG